MSVQNEMLSGISLAPICWSSVPDTIKPQLEERLAWNRVREDNPNKSFDAILHITASDHAVRFAGHFSFSPFDSHPAIRRIDVVESIADTPMGWGAMVLHDDGRQQPFVAYTETQPNYRRKGFGIRRIQVLNAVSEAIWGPPLRSSTLISPEAMAVWEKLYSLRVVELLSDPSGNPIFRFIPKAGLRT